jgi:cytochrome c553
MIRCLIAFFLMLPSVVFSLEDINAGKIKSATCAVCHGAQGVSSNPQWPNLAGQHASYLDKQLQDFKPGNKREVATMTPMIASFSQEDLANISAYYASLPRAKKESTSEKYRKRGETLYKVGDSEKHITACIACHGPKGDGNKQAGFPVLAGQNALYTILQLQAFKTSKRANDLQEIMRDISARMSEEDITAIAHYLEGL